MHENKKCHHFKAGKAFGFKNSSYICSMKQIKVLFLAVSLGFVVLLAISCGKQDEQRVQQVSDVDLQLDRAHQTHNYDSLLLLVDSFVRQVPFPTSRRTIGWVMSTSAKVSNAWLRFTGSMP